MEKNIKNTENVKATKSAKQTAVVENLTAESWTAMTADEKQKALDAAEKNIKSARSKGRGKASSAERAQFATIEGGVAVIDLNRKAYAPAFKYIWTDFESITTDELIARLKACAKTITLKVERLENKKDADGKVEKDADGKTIKVGTGVFDSFPHTHIYKKNNDAVAAVYEYDEKAKDHKGKVITEGKSASWSIQRKAVKSYHAADLFEIAFEGEVLKGKSPRVADIKKKELLLSIINNVNAILAGFKADSDNK